ncbi:MAG: hypothetical protein H0U46_04865 [Actinobacteria bacterium]|nr:hypothetical protein [Actinomycetota bacterium]
MRIPFTDRELRLFATPQGDLNAPPSGISGSDSESWYSGVFSAGSEINPLFRGRSRYLVFNEMRTADAWVRAILWLYKLPIRNATHEVVARDEGKDPIDRAVARACEWQFGLGDHVGRLSQSHDEWLTQRLLCLDWGAVLEEIIWASELEFWREDPDKPEQRPMRSIARMGLRRPSTIKEIKWDAESAAITRVFQDLPNVPESGIPGEKIAHYSIERDGETDWMGTSLLRAMYQPWRLKKAVTTSSAIAWDRWASGLPEIRYPKSGGTRDEERAQRIAQNLRTHEKGYVAFAGPEISPTETEGWGLKIHTGDAKDPTNLLRHYDSQMAAAALVMFSQLGITETGSRAVGETIAEPYYLSVSAVAKQIALDSQRDVIRRFVDVNFGKEIETPTVRVRKISQRSAEAVINALSLLAGAGYDVVHPQIRDTVLEMLDLDALPEGLTNGARPEGGDVFPAATRQNGTPSRARTAAAPGAAGRRSSRGGGVPGAATRPGV